MAILMKEPRTQNLTARQAGPAPGSKNRYFFVFVCVLLSLLCALTSANAERIKDIASFEGVRDNQLIGYGLIVGLSGTGDKGESTIKSVVNMLVRLGLTVNTNEISTKNIAAVIVTATLPPFAKPGMKLDALVSTIGDATNIQGGTLLLTPLTGPDGEVYALAQGPVSIGGFSAEGAGSVAQKNHLTAGKIPDGITIEQEIPFTLGNGIETRLFLHKADFVTANKMAEKINQSLNGNYAVPIDSASIRLTVPEEHKNNLVGLIARLETVNVQVDMPAKIIINERTGTVVIGETVKISPVAIAHGALTIEIKTRTQVSQPPPFAPESARTVTAPQSDIAVREQDAALVEVSGVTLGEVIRALNTLGVTPRDLISILQALKASGALKAQLELI
jgi:flagellar P-ring protein precursor FlgI